MTLYTIIEKVYAMYSICDASEIDFEEMRQDIINKIEAKWPDLEYTSGLSFNYDGVSFDVLLDDELKQEFYNKHPEALI